MKQNNSHKLVFGLGLFCLAVLFFNGKGNAGTVTGKVVFEGSAPEASSLDLGADPTCLTLHPEGLKSEEWAINPDGTLKNVFVYVKEGLEGQLFTPPQEPVVLDQQGCRYTPHVFGLQTNQPLELVNSDSTLHNVHALPQANKEFNLGMPIPGMKMKKTFTTPEIMVKFKCDVHPWMSAYAGVLPHPFFSVSDEKGSFEIKDLPAGEYVIEAWHEKLGTQVRTVRIESQEAGPEITFQYSAVS